MAFKLNYKAYCECCEDSVEVTAYSFLDANQRISQLRWNVVNEGKPSEAKHYCPKHKPSN